MFPWINFNNMLILLGQKLCSFFSKLCQKLCQHNTQDSRGQQKSSLKTKTRAFFSLSFLWVQPTLKNPLTAKHEGVSSSRPKERTNTLIYSPNQHEEHPDLFFHMGAPRNHTISVVTAQNSVAPMFPLHVRLFNKLLHTILLESLCRMPLISSLKWND